MPADNLVRALRIFHGETQEDLARAIGRSRQTVSAIENGRWQPSLRTMQDIARHFRVAVDVVFPAVHVEERQDLVARVLVRQDA